jgi:hypothetical protein
LREIAAELEAQGFVTKSGKPFQPGVVQDMLAVSWPEVERTIAGSDAC